MENKSHGHFDIIGDIHGCYDELIILLKKLDYKVSNNQVTHPKQRRVVFLGDLVDRGPSIVNVLKLVMAMVSSGIGLCVAGNHDMKLYRKLNGNNVVINHGLEDSLQQLAHESDEFINELQDFLSQLNDHYVLDDGKLVVAHAGMKEEYQGQSSKRISNFALYGQTTGKTDDNGYPIRYDWASEYQGRALVVYGHTPQANGLQVNNTINIDTGCVFGGKLTALRYPEIEIVDVASLRIYYQSGKPFL